MIDLLADKEDDTLEEKERKAKQREVRAYVVGLTDTINKLRKRLVDFPFQDGTTEYVDKMLAYSRSTLAKGMYFGYPNLLGIINVLLNMIEKHSAKPLEGDWSNWSDMEDIELILDSIESMCVGTKMFPKFKDYVISPRTSHVQELHNNLEKGSGKI